tara:strand:- start:195 stop:392 length:198 start_codon:yes stop_codon:yes gene_type:complete
MTASKNGLRPKYIPPFSKRKDFCRKIRETQKKIHKLKTEGEWRSVSHLGYVLRHAWWGYKRYYSI